jgi:hypothetical protein
VAGHEIDFSVAVDVRYVHKLTDRLVRGRKRREGAIAISKQYLQVAINGSYQVQFPVAVKISRGEQLGYLRVKESYRSKSSVPFFKENTNTSGAGIDDVDDSVVIEVPGDKRTGASAAKVGRWRAECAVAFTQIHCQSANRQIRYVIAVEVSHARGGDGALNSLNSDYRWGKTAVTIAQHCGQIRDVTDGIS